MAKTPKAKSPNYIFIVLHILKLASFLIAVVSALLSWMFAVANTVSLGTANTDTINESQVEGFSVVARISANLADIAVYMTLTGLATVILGFLISKNNDQKFISKDRLAKIIILSFVLIAVMALQNNILGRLIIHNY
ncbi:MAG TPA: hypothetical protein VFX86_03240 [Candidatus Saccharimonadales bacterium]|nr:hypothetical protein [Candidatus Saccharimonadales bacterium]